MWSLDHVYGSDGTYHAWHVVPARVGFAVAFVPLCVLASPIILIEEAVGGSSIFREGPDGVSTYLVGYPSFAMGYVVAAPFLVAGLPWDESPP